MRRAVVVELEEEVLAKIEEEAQECGITVEEMIRYNIGSYFRRMAGTPMLRIPSLPSAKPAVDPFMLLAKIVAAQGLAKCPICFTTLNSEDIISGKCPKCAQVI